jgi:hypothetical protein
MDSEAVDRNIANADLRKAREALSIRGTPGASTRQTTFAARLAGRAGRALRSPRRRLRTHLPMLAALALAAGAGCEKPPPAAPAPERILLITIDTLRADAVSFELDSEDKTPFLASLARDAVVFRNAYAPSSWTVPSMASLFTSLAPSSHGVVRDLAVPPSPNLINRTVHGNPREPDRQVLPQHRN